MTRQHCQLRHTRSSASCCSLGQIRRYLSQQLVWIGLEIRLELLVQLDVACFDHVGIALEPAPPYQLVMHTAEVL